MSEKKITLLVMAAGMGSRFGGLKQIAPVGPNAETILDYSIYDAKEAGFSKTIFIIKKQIERDFRNAVGKHIEKRMDVDYAFQEMDKIPSPFAVPAGRVKPWGTSHAVLCAKEHINTPFAVINADDYYGKNAYRSIASHLKTSGEFCMVAYQLENTLSDSGAVSRGICEIKDGYLVRVTEHPAIERKHNFPAGTFVSMNMWGFTPTIFEELEEKLLQFLRERGTEKTSEFLLPLTVDGMIQSGRANVKALPCADKWYGVTYQEDTPVVKAAIARLVSEGQYEHM